VRESARITALALCLWLLAALGPSCSVDQRTSATAGGDAGADVINTGGTGGLIEGAAGWAGYGASGGAPACAAKGHGTSQLSDAQFVYHAFQTLLGHAPDPVAFEFRLNELTNGAARPAVYAALAASKELADNPALKDKAGFLDRVYGVLLGRPPTDAELAAVVPQLHNFDGKGPGTTTWYEEFVSVQVSEEYASIPRPLIGVHFGMPVDPVVSLTDADFLKHAYLVLLARDYDVTGMLLYLDYLQTNSRPMTFQALIGSAEFAANPALASLTGFVGRVYDAVLGRSPTAEETTAALKNLQKADGTGGSKSWYQLYVEVVQSAEFKTKNCATEYYVYDAQLPTDEPILRDVTNGAARIQKPGEATPVQLTFDGTTGAIPSGNEKIVTFVDPESKETYALIRALEANSTFNMFLFKMEDPGGTSFSQKSGPLLQKAPTEQHLDPHLAIDNSVCPRRFVLGTLCSTGACISYTTTPTVPETWSRPQTAITNCVPLTANCADRYVNAWSSVTLFDHRQPYFGWQELDEGPTQYQSAGFVNPDDGVESASTSAQAFNPYQLTPATVVAADKQSLLPAEPNPKCTTAWDCDNRSISDWRREGAYFYLLYAGANYHRCKRPDVDLALPNQWGIGVASSLSALDNYTRPLEPSVVFAEAANTCGISYPFVNRVGEKLYVYYASYDTSNVSSLWRAAIDCQ
jgi:hypothetical protein